MAAQGSRDHCFIPEEEELTALVRTGPRLTPAPSKGTWRIGQCGKIVPRHAVGRHPLVASPICLIVSSREREQRSISLVYMSN